MSKLNQALKDLVSALADEKEITTFDLSISKVRACLSKATPLGAPEIRLSMSTLRVDGSGHCLPHVKISAGAMLKPPVLDDVASKESLLLGLVACLKEVTARARDQDKFSALAVAHEICGSMAPPGRGTCGPPW